MPTYLTELNYRRKGRIVHVGPATDGEYMSIADYNLMHVAWRNS